MDKLNELMNKLTWCSFNEEVEIKAQIRQLIYDQCARVRAEAYQDGRNVERALHVKN